MNGSRVLGVVLSGFALASAPSAYATNGVLSGTVAEARTYEPGSWAGPPKFLFSLNGITSAGNCILVNGRVMFVGGSKDMFITVLSAQLTSRAISVWFDDAYKTNSYCVARGVFAGDPPPEN